jgi:hypothetical protein
VRIVSAGVHDTRDLRSVLPPRNLVERQGIHVGAQQQRRPRPGTLQIRHHAGPADTSSRFEPDRAQPASNQIRSLRLGESELGAAMQRAPRVD